MVKLFSKATAVGARPGTLLIPEGSPPPRIHLIRYDGDAVIEHRVDSLDTIRAEIRQPGVCWIDVQGLGSEETLWGLADIFSIHILALEGAVNVPQRPSTETYPDHQFFVSRMVRLTQNKLTVEQVTVFFGRSAVLTIQERYGDVLDPVRERIRLGKGPIRKSGADYLAYAIIDTIIDGYYPVLEAYGELLETLETEVIDQATPRMLNRINRVKRDLMVLRRGIWPLRDALNAVVRDESPFVSPDVRIFFRDSYDHCVQVADVLETFREAAGALLSTYLSAAANSTNEIMKVLTIMASVFIPLTFLAGIYGMNFENMPELSSPWAYPMLIATMVVTAAALLVYFKHKGWILNRPPDDEPGVDPE